MSDDALAGEESEPATAVGVGDDEDVGDERSSDEGTDESRVRRYIDYVLLAGFLLLAGVAVVSLYLSASQVITDWIAPEFRSLFRTAFNLVVLLVVGVGISWQLRRLR
ncbi:hypothetical protein [Salinirubrum litoreum]|uniref:DUF8060 domain-containing protein n=1 Tax=Salinirubrum litoreum TaxID=1126234 RepID=A0ABD5RA15_9EURY|nr:hypothetical protein [Salinirubrum litoreum]